MIHFVLGLHGRLAQWCDTVMAALLALEGAPVTAHLATGLQPFLDEAAVQLVRSRAAYLVACVRQPDETLKAALADLQARFVLALEDPRAAVVVHHEQAGHDLVVSVRNVANLCPLLMAYAAMPGAFVVRTRDIADGGVGVVQAMARHLSVAVSPEQAHAIAEALAGVNAGAPYAGFATPLQDADQKMVDGALAAYGILFGGEGLSSAALGEIRWTRQLFLVGKDPARRPYGVVDLRDGANGRFVAYGPYMHLPAGYWSATIVMGLSPEAVGQTFTVDVITRTQILASTKVSPRSSGIFTADLSFATHEGQQELLELRVMIGRDSAPGQLAFGHVVLQAISSQHAGRSFAPDADFLSALQL